MGAFEDFVNLELPKRIATNEHLDNGTGNLLPGKYLRTTGVGILVETVDPSTVAGGGGQPLRRVLYRTGGQVAKDTPIDINAPGAGWTTAGVDVLFSDGTDFVETIQVFHNGVLQLAGESSGDDNDVYFVAASGTIAFEDKIKKNDVVQVWGVTASG
jgi:hypothetical protein